MATTHPAGDLPPIVVHSSSLLPSKSTIASEGDAPGVAPGVTTSGTGSQNSVSSGLGLAVAAACAGAAIAEGRAAGVAGACAKSGRPRAIKAAEERRLENRMRVIR